MNLTWQNYREIGEELFRAIRFDQSVDRSLYRSAQVCDESGGF